MASALARYARRVAFAVAALTACSRPAGAQGGLLFQGVADLELWKTDSASRLLARNGGKAGVLARADVWAAVEPIRNVVFFGELYREVGFETEDNEYASLLKQGGVRIYLSDALRMEAGKLQQIVGAFSARQHSYRNPLIGAPDGYALSYPVGARVDGTWRMLDYRAGMLSLPLYRPGYTPDPSAAMRSSMGAGITPMMGVRFGMSAMLGPYLRDDYAPALLRSQDWKSYKQRVIAADAQVSHGYLEVNAELAHGVYDVPGRPTAMKGLLYYIEPKYQLTPRLHLAGRYERNDYPFIRPVTATVWVANRVVFQDVELGAGFRPTASTLLKLSVRADHWAPNASAQAPKDNGYAVVAQWSQRFDLVELATRQQ